jgi:predicted ATP-grasp superfamily ATP-dependent carboligase
MAFPEPEMGVPTFADIPAGGQPVKAGRPILTLFAIGDTPADCRRRLRSVAAELEQRLYE